MRWLIPIAISVIILAVMTGCSTGSNPVGPGTDQENPIVQDINGNSESSTGVHTNLFGYYDIYFDPETGTMEAVENRTADFTLNIVPLLNHMTSPNKGITLTGFVLDNSVPGKIGIDVVFGITNPVPGIPQFYAYDLLGVVIGDGSQILDYNSLEVAEYGTDLYMKNPDGYTRWFNPQEFTSNNFFGYYPGGFANYYGLANVNPYKYYCSGLAPDQDIWDFLTGGSNNEGLFDTSGRLMQLEFVYPPAGVGIKFGYAVVVEWEDQGGGPYTPYNRTEAVAHETVQVDSLYYNTTDGSGGNLRADISLYEWEEQPDNIIIESTVLDSSHSFVASDIETAVSGNTRTYHIDIPSDPFVGNDGHEMWVIAQYDSFDYHNGLPGTIAPSGPVSAFFRDSLTVGTEPTCDVEVTGIVPNQGMVDELIIGAEIICTQIADGPDLAAYLSNGTDTFLGTNTMWVDTNTITCDFDLTGATEGLYDLTVHDGVCPNPGTLTNAFEIFSCVVDVNGIIPTLGVVDSVIVGAEIICTQIADGPDLDAFLSNGTDTILGTNMMWVDANTITCDFDLTGVSEGPYDLTVHDGICPNPGTLPDAFTVIPCSTDFVGVTPIKGAVDTMKVIHIELANCVDGPSFEAVLQKSGETDIVSGLMIWEDYTHFQAEFDLTGAALGLWDLYVVNGCGGTGDTGVAVFEVIVEMGIMQTDTTPISTGVTPVPGDALFSYAIDIGCATNDGGFYLAWSQDGYVASGGYLDGGYVDRYDPLGGTVLMHALCDPSGTEDIQFSYERVGLDAGSVGASNGWACTVDPLIHFGSDETSSDGANDSYGVWAGYPDCWTADACGPASGNVYSYANYNVGTNECVICTHYNLNWDNSEPTSWTYNTVASDIDGRENAGEMPWWRTNVMRLTMGQTQDDFWNLSMTAPHVRNYTDWNWTSLGGTEFGIDGTGDGEIAAWTDSGTPDYKRTTGPVDITARGIGGQTRLYVLDEPTSGNFRIQCFDDTGALLATSGELVCADFGATQVYALDYQAFFDVMYVLFDNNTVAAFVDTTI